jgi:hypothetical protein
VSSWLLGLCSKEVDVPSRLVFATSAQLRRQSGNQRNQLTCDIRDVVASLLLPHRFDLGDVLGGELDLFEVLDDARRRHGFRDHAVPADFGPGESAVELVGDGMG